MGRCRLSRVSGVIVCALAFSAQASMAQSGKWDPGVPSKLFQEGKTEGKNPKPTHRLAPTDCDDCQKIVDELQAALDDWYVMQLAEAKAIKIDYTDTSSAGTERQEAKKKQEGDAMAGLGQPNTKDLNAKQKQQKKDAKDKKDTHGSKEALAKEIKRLTDALQECLKKCAPPEEGAGQTQPGTETPTSTPEEGGQPGGGGKPNGHGVKPLPTLPTLPDCWKTPGQKKQFDDDLNAAEQDLLKLRGYYGTHGGFSGDEGDREAAAKEVNKALNKINDLKEQAEKVKDCPHSMAPRQPTGQYFASLLNDGSIKVETTGTGETIGHVADFVIQNLTDGPIECVIPPMILESGSGKNQDYACPKRQEFALKPHESKTIPVDGVCLNRHKPPVGKGVGGDLLVNDGSNPVQDRRSHLKKKDADKLLRICEAKYEAAEKLQKDGALKDLPYHDKQKQKDICVQWSTWADPRISEITGSPPATKDDLKKVVYRQAEQNGPVTPDTKKKIDEGIDTIFDKIELTTEKAKDLEKPETGESGVPPIIEQPQTVGMPTPTPGEPIPRTTERPSAATPTPSGGDTTHEKSANEATPTPAPLTQAHYPVREKTDCGDIEVTVGTKGDLIFDFKPNGKCPCKEFGWIQHISPAEYDNWRYDNGVMSGIGSKKVGAKSDPTLPKQPTQPPKGTKLGDWENNPWYGGTTDPKKPQDFDEHPTPQTYISDTPTIGHQKFITQLVCVTTGEVYFSWAWGPTDGTTPVDKLPGAQVPPPPPKK
jgi:hypothetical protein